MRENFLEWDEVELRHREDEGIDPENENATEIDGEDARGREEGGTSEKDFFLTDLLCLIDTRRWTNSKCLQVCGARQGKVEGQRQGTRTWARQAQEIVQQIQVAWTWQVTRQVETWIKAKAVDERTTHYHRYPDHLVYL